MIRTQVNDSANTVALCEEGVDRNGKWCPTTQRLTQVALCEEGVDRNIAAKRVDGLSEVALCEEGVDRNITPKWDEDTEACRPLRRGRG